MAVRCCSPPESWRGTCLRLGGQSDDRQHAVDRRADLAARRAGHLERERDVLPDRLGRQQLEVLEDDPDLAAHLRAPGGAADRARSWPSSTTSPRVAISSRMSSLMSVDLPAPGRADEEHEVAFGDDQVDVAQRDLAVRVLLRDVVQDEDRAIREAWSRPRSRIATAQRARRRRRWGDGHRRLRGREGVTIGRRHGWASVRLRPRARQREPRRPEATIGPPSGQTGPAGYRRPGRWSGPERPHGGTV